MSVSASVSGSVLELTFGTGDWDTVQSVRVHADDDDDLVDDTATLRHEASGGGYVGVSGDVAVTVTDDDVAALVLDPVSVSVGEGARGGYGVRLSARPSGSVSVVVSVSAGGDLVLGRAGDPLSVSVSASDSGSVLALTFGTGDWDTYQSVRVHADDDDDLVDDTATLRHEASGGGYVGVSGDVAVTVTDDDVAALVLDPVSVSVGEGARGGYGVRLSARPSGSVSVVVSVSAGGDLVLGRAGDPLSVSVSASDSGSVLALTFGTGDWDTYQSVRVHADDDDDLVDDTATLRHEASGGGYVGVSGDVAVTVTDDDVAALVLDPVSVSVGEGARVGYGVRLSARPSGSVSVVVSVSAGGDLVLGRAGDPLSVSASVAGPVLTLTFGTGDWDTVQSVRVHADEDDDFVDDTATLRHTANGGGYVGVTGDVAVTVADDDTAPPPPPPAPPPPAPPPPAPPPAPAPPPPAPVPRSGIFADVDIDSVHRPAIETMYHSGITAGCGTQPLRFCPEMPVTRAQMASFLYRALGLGDAPRPAGFVDVDPRGTHAAAIDALSHAGITAGCGTGPLRFCPEMPVTRAQMASFLHRALGLADAARSAGFVDVDPQSPHAAAIDALYHNDVTKGCGSDPLRYCPYQHLTRAQMASLLQRALDLGTTA